MMLKIPRTETNNYLIKQLPNATAFLNTKLEVMHASDKWIEYFNFTHENVIGKKISELFGGVNKNWHKVMNDCLKGKGGGSGKEQLLDHDNENHWFEWTNTPWFDENENIRGVIIQTEDVTELVNREMELEMLDRLLRDKSEITKIGSWNFCIRTQELVWCDLTRKILEVSDDFIPTIENGVSFYKHGYSRNTIAMAVEKALQEEVPWNLKLQVVTAKGNEKWVAAAGKPMYKNGEFIGLLGTFQDVDDQVKAELKSKESELLLKTLIDNLPLNVFIKDIDSKKILVNKAECEYLGVKNSKDLIGKTDFDLYDKEMAQISRDEDLYVMNTLTPILGRETQNRKSDGKVTTFLTSKIPLLRDDGSANGLVGISLDITKLKQKEEELIGLINVTSLQNKKLVNFAHIVSHNLRSHSANFSMLLDFLINERNGEERKNIIKMLVEASDNLLDTLENLNEVVAINTNTNLDKKPIKFNKTLSNVSQSLTAFLKNNNAKITNTISDDLIVKVIPSYLESIIMNFITNAIKYKEPTRDPEIHLSAVKEGNYTVISIADNGLGIDLKKYGDKLFGMYKTFHSNKDARGIGLYITKNQIEAMGGKVKVTSQPGKGSTFNIYFHE